MKFFSLDRWSDARNADAFSSPASNFTHARSFASATSESDATPGLYSSLTVDSNYSRSTQYLRFIGRTGSIAVKSASVKCSASAVYPVAYWSY